MGQDPCKNNDKTNKKEIDEKVKLIGLCTNPLQGRPHIVFILFIPL